MLLHLLTNVINLPVTKSTIKDSGLGKAIGAIGKHSICKDSPNESAINDRVQKVKDAWNALAKARKPVEISKDAVKREAPDELSSTSPSKKHKTDIEPKKVSSFTNLLKKVSGSPNGVASTETVSINSKAKGKVVGLTSNVHAAVEASIPSAIKENATITANQGISIQEKQGKP
jgi:TFIIS helical bundle-like domain